MVAPHVIFVSDETRDNPNTSSSPPPLVRAHSTTTLDARKPPERRQPVMSRSEATESTRLLEGPSEERGRSYTDALTESPEEMILRSRRSSIGSLRTYRSHLRKDQSRVGIMSPTMFTRSGLRTPRLHRSLILNDQVVVDDRTWYDQFTSTDWVHDSIADGYRVRELQRRKDFRGRLWLIFDASQGWILVAIIGFLTAAVAYVIDITEAAIFDLKRGYCTTGWYLKQAHCCNGNETCPDWRTWSQIIHPSRPDDRTGDYIGFILGCVIFAMIACCLTLLSKTVIPSHVASTLDENLGAQRSKEAETETAMDTRPAVEIRQNDPRPAMTYYAAAGSGVAEVKVILSGFVLHGYLGVKTLLLKCPALIFSVASGMSLGKEGPYVHIATCIGNIACRMFAKYNLNDGKRREVMSAAAASGVTVAFGSPLGGVLFSLEEVSYFFPPKTLFRTFFCCIVAALWLKFLNPYGTNKIALFEVRYVTGWRAFELLAFALLGVIGGLAGAMFIKASRFWATTFRRIKTIKKNPWLEVLIVALITGIITFWNRYANLAVAELLLELASPCSATSHTGLCPKTRQDIPKVIGELSIAFIIKACLTVVTFGIKVPAGIYVPSMVCGGLVGRIVGHTVQYVVLGSPDSWLFGHCSSPDNIEQCVTPGVYALVAAGATMCGVTRLSVTLATILLELTGSLDHVLPFAIGVLVAKWTADYVEPSSIYDLLIDMNSYPFIDNKQIPHFDTDTELGDITPRFRGERIIDISISPYVRASELRTKLDLLHDAGELDGGLPIIREKALIGFIPAPDLEFALDGLEGPEEETLCLMSRTDQIAHATGHRRWFAVLNEDQDDDEDDDAASSHRSLASSASNSPNEEVVARNAFEADFVRFIDPAPINLEVHSSLHLVYQCFAKLGLRYICVVEAGEYRGMVHKKLFVKHLKTLEAKHL